MVQVPEDASELGGVISLTEYPSQKPISDFEESSSIENIVGSSPKQASENEDIQSIGSFLLQREFIGKEKWKTTHHIPGMIVEVTPTYVAVECLRSKKLNYYEVRKFPAVLFENLSHLNAKDTVLIKIKMKGGSQRTDIFDGKGLVKPSEFEYAGDWTGIDNSMSQPLKNW